MDIISLLQKYSSRLHKKYPPPDKPIYLFCYHKVGTILLAKVFRRLCDCFGWEFRSVLGFAETIPRDANVVLFMHSLVDFFKINHDYVGAHFIRDPRDVIVSGYLYHQRCGEDWCVLERPDPTRPILFPNIPWSQQHRSDDWKEKYIESLNGISYQNNLRNRNQADGLLFEMARYGAWTIESMADWDYSNTKIKEVRFESIMSDYDSTFSLLFKHFGFSEEQVRKGLKIAAREDLKRQSERQLRRNEHISSKETTKWNKYFQQAHKETFLELFPDVLIRLGYESDNNW